MNGRITYFFCSFSYLHFFIFKFVYSRILFAVACIFQVIFYEIAHWTPIFLREPLDTRWRIWGHFPGIIFHEYICGFRCWTLESCTLDSIFSGNVAGRWGCRRVVFFYLLRIIYLFIEFYMLSELLTQLIKMIYVNVIAL